MFFNIMGLIRFELMTPSLSEKCSNHLSYSPEQKIQIKGKERSKVRRTCWYIHNTKYYLSLRKEVIQPHLPIRLPCYDLTPIIEPTFGHSLLAVRTWTSGVPDFHGLTGGVYKARERIHRGMLIRDY